MHLLRSGTPAAFGLVTASLVLMRIAQAAEPPAPPVRGDVERVLAAAREPAPPVPPRPLTIVLLADRKDHGENEHDYPRWQARWALLLGGERASAEKAANLYGQDISGPEVNQGAAGVRVTCANGWPSASEWEAADLVVAYCYIPWTPSRLQDVAAFLERGGGLVLIHSATWTRPKPSPEVAELVGVGGFRRWRHGALELQIVQPEHPICRGLPPTIHWIDEPYWPPTPPIDPQRVEVLAGSREETESGSSETSLQPQFWTYRQRNGRVFGCVPGHYAWTFDDPFFRILLLRGMAWAAGEDPYRFDGLVLRSAAVADN